MGAPVQNLFLLHCQATSKRGFSTKKRAKKVAKTLGKGVGVYLCEDCNYFHVGHRNGMTREQHRIAAQGRRINSKRD